MATKKSFCLRSNKFPDIICQSIKILRSEQDFADVTLACEDGKMVETHKVILAGSSPILSDLLKKLNNPHPLIYLKGVTLVSLQAVLDFLYTGEAEVAEECLTELLMLADQLEIAGLKSDEGEQKTEFRYEQNVSKLAEAQDGRYQSQLMKIENPNDTPWDIPDTGTQNIPLVPKETRQKSFDSKYPWLGQKNYTKLSSLPGMKKNIKNTDDKEASYVRCDQCDQILTSKKVLKIHIRKQHVLKDLVSN